MYPKLIKPYPEVKKKNSTILMHHENVRTKLELININERNSVVNFLRKIE